MCDVLVLEPTIFGEIKFTRGFAVFCLIFVVYPRTVSVSIFFSRFSCSDMVFVVVFCGGCCGIQSCPMSPSCSNIIYNLVPVVQREGNAIRWINRYLVDNSIGFDSTNYPLGSDLSGG